MFCRLQAAIENSPGVYETGSRFVAFTEPMPVVKSLVLPSFPLRRFRFAAALRAGAMTTPSPRIEGQSLPGWRSQGRLAPHLLAQEAVKNPVRVKVVSRDLPPKLLV
jgi:hypothetical protein